HRSLLGSGARLYGASVAPHKLLSLGSVACRSPPRTQKSGYTWITYVPSNLCSRARVLKFFTWFGASFEKKPSLNTPSDVSTTATSGSSGAGRARSTGWLFSESIWQRQKATF